MVNCIGAEQAADFSTLNFIDFRAVLPGLPRLKLVHL